MSDTEQPTEPFNVGDAIKELIATGDPKGAAQNAKVSGWALPKLKVMARALGLPTNQNKKELIEAIFAKRDAQTSLQDIMTNRNSNSTFRRNKDTIPRICNLIMQYPDALERSFALATKQQLQDKEVNGSQKIFVAVADNFNDWNYNSGGCVDETDPVFDGIDPERENKSGKITSQLVYNHWKDVIKLYSNYLANWEESGKHNGHDFWRYCMNNVDVYYLYFILRKLGNPEISSFCAEGTILPFGIDSGESSGPSTNTSASVPSYTRKRKGTDNTETEALQAKTKLSNTMQVLQTLKIKEEHMKIIQDLEDRYFQVMKDDPDDSIGRVKRTKAMLDDAVAEYEKFKANNK